MSTLPTTRETTRSDRIISPSIQVIEGLILPRLNPFGIIRTVPLHDLLRGLGGSNLARLPGANPGPVETDRIQQFRVQKAISELGDTGRAREFYANWPRPAPPISLEPSL